MYQTGYEWKQILHWAWYDWHYNTFFSRRQNYLTLKYENALDKFEYHKICVEFILVRFLQKTIE